MWKDYSVSYIKNNRAASISIMVAALISTLCLSFLCSLFFNLWVSETNGIIEDEGNWQGRITGTLSDADIPVIRNFSNVKSVEWNEELSDENAAVVDLSLIHIFLKKSRNGRFGPDFPARFLPVCRPLLPTAALSRVSSNIPGSFPPWRPPALSRTLPGIPAFH